MRAAMRRAQLPRLVPVRITPCEAAGALVDGYAAAARNSGAPRTAQASRHPPQARQDTERLECVKSEMH